MFIRFFLILVGFGISTLSGCVSKPHLSKSLTHIRPSHLSYPYSLYYTGFHKHDHFSSSRPSSGRSTSPSSPTPNSPWFFIMGTISTSVGVIGMSSPHSCGRFTSDGRCMSSTFSLFPWNIVALGGITLTIIGWIQWKVEKDSLYSIPLKETQ